MAANETPDEQTTKGKRAAFKADFERASAAQEDAECLSVEEILSFEAGHELDPVAREHLTHCHLCSALTQAIRVDPDRLRQFQDAVHQTYATADRQVRRYQPAPFGWRLPAAAAAAFASLALFFVLPKSAPVVSQSAAVSVRAPKATPSLEISSPRPNNSPAQVEIALKSPSGQAMQFVSTTPTTVKEVAPQIATAAVLSKSALTLPVNASAKESAGFRQQASDILLLWMSSGSDSLPLDSSAVAYLPNQKVFHIKLSGDASLTVPRSALAHGRVVKAEVLTNQDLHKAMALLSDQQPVNVSTKLSDGSALTIDSVPRAAQKTSSKMLPAKAR